MVRGCLSNQMGVTIKDNFFSIEQMMKMVIIGHNNLNILEDSKKTCFMDMQKKWVKIIDLKDTTKKISRREVYYNGKLKMMNINMKDHLINLESFQERVSSSIHQGSLLETLLMAKSMDLAHLFLQMD